MSFVFSFLMTLFLTFIIEIPAVLFCLKFSSRHTEIRTSKIISANLIASSSTFLFFWIIIPLLILEGGVGYGYRMRIPITRNSYIYLAEIFITLIEALIYKRMLKLKLAEALITSLVANLASFWVGFYLLNGHIFITFIKKRFIIRFIPWW